MDFTSLTKYVNDKFGLKFIPTVSGNYSLLILSSPVDHSWFAVLSHFQIKGAKIWALDIKCGDFAATIRDLPSFCSAYRLHDANWVGILLDKGNDEEIKKIIDYAYRLACNPQHDVASTQYMYLSGNRKGKYQAQQIDFSHYQLHKEEEIPQQLQKMLASYDYSILPAKGRAKNFYLQGKMMADYQDDYTDRHPFYRLYPTYHDMNIKQLRTYFTWRTALNQGKFYANSSGYAYVYLFELLNNISDSPENNFQRLLSFQQHYAEKYDIQLRRSVKRWLHDYVIYYQLQQHLDLFADMQKADHNYCVLLKPEAFTDEEVVTALTSISSYHFIKQVTQQHDFIFFLASVWRQLSRSTFFEQYIASRMKTQLQLFSGAVFYDKDLEKKTFVIDAERKYCGQGREYVLSRIKPFRGQKSNVNLLLHEVDRLLRKYWHLGRPLKARNLEKKYLQLIKAGILKAAAKKQKQKLHVDLDLSKLSAIRGDAAKTRDSLLTDEEKAESAAAESSITDETKPAAVPEGTPFSSDELFLLRSLLHQSDYHKYLQQKNIMLSIICEQINEKMLDIIGDSAIDFTDEGKPQLISDYLEDVKAILKEQ